MELYVHDLSALFAQVKLGEDGRFGYPALPSYLSGENGRSAFVLRHEGCVAGFVLVRRGSPASDDPSVLDVAEFFVMRKFRRHGVGTVVATRLFVSFRGHWEVRELQTNPPAISFWRRVIALYTNGNFEETLFDDDRWRGPVQSFRN